MSQPHEDGSRDSFSLWRRLSRRAFVGLLARVTGAAAAVWAFAGARGSRAHAAQVDPQDPSILAEMVRYPSDGASIAAYSARPRAGGPYPAMIVVHENRGLSDHIQDVARRLAKAGYLALAPDLLSRAGGTAQLPRAEESSAALRRLGEKEIPADLRAAHAHLTRDPAVRPDRIGIIGFCWGGGTAFRAALDNPALRAVVVYYGPNPSPLDRVANLQAAFLGIYGEEDPFIMPGVGPLREALARYNRPHEIHTYPGAPHAFHNDTGPERYRPEAARDAWAKTLAFLGRHLGS